MALLPLADVDHLAAFVGQDIPDDERPRAEAVLRMASSLVRAYVGHSYDAGEVPDVAADVTVDVAARVWFNPEGVVGDAIDDMNRRWSESRAHEGFYLTGSNKMMLDPLRTKPNGGLWTLGVTKGDDHLGTMYVPTGPPPSGYPFPWYAADDPLIR